jgi:hypothetical protein
MLPDKRRSMSFKDDLVKAIEQARSDERRKRWETLTDDEWWTEIRDTEIIPAFKEAVQALTATEIGGVIAKMNGGSGSKLVAGHKDPKPYLTFTHSTKDSIKVTSFLEGELDEEEWDDRKLTLATIASKVRDFVVIVAASHLPDAHQRLSYDRIGPRKART